TSPITLIITDHTNHHLPDTRKLTHSHTLSTGHACTNQMLQSVRQKYKPKETHTTLSLTHTHTPHSLSHTHTHTTLSHTHTHTTLSHTHTHARTHTFSTGPGIL